MWTLRIVVSADRRLTGSITLTGERGEVIAGPFGVSTTSSLALAAKQGNAQRDPLLRYGHTPLGRYRVVSFIEPSRLASGDFGEHGALLLRPLSGQCVLAEANGRFRHLIHAGGRRMRSSAGAVRVRNRDFVAMVQTLAGSESVECEIIEGVVEGAEPVFDDPKCQAPDPAPIGHGQILRGALPIERRNLLKGGALGGAIAFGGAVTFFSAGGVPQAYAQVSYNEPPTSHMGYSAGAIGAQRAAAAAGLPDFGPIPQWSAVRVFRRAECANFLRISRLPPFPNLFDMGDRLAQVLSQAGYSDYGFYWIEGGFALVARLEKINDDGTPAAPARFTSPRDEQPFGFTGFLASLLFGDEGFYRVIVFAVTNRPLVADAGPPTVRAAEAWFTRAATELPSSYRRLRLTSDHTLTALIYEFRKGAGSDETSVTPVVRLSSDQHLMGAHIYGKLGLGAR